MSKHLNDCYRQGMIIANYDLHDNGDDKFLGSFFRIDYQDEDEAYINPNEWNFTGDQGKHRPEHVGVEVVRPFRTHLWECGVTEEVVMLARTSLNYGLSQIVRTYEYFNCA